MTQQSIVPLAVPNLDAAEEELVAEAVRSTFVSSVGPFVSDFEAEFAAAVGAQFAVACSSGTAALHVAMRLAGVGAGDVVAVSDFTFIASASAAVYQGAELLLVDADPATWCMDAALLADELQRRSRSGEVLPKVVEPAHILGQPSSMEPLVDLCEEYGITLIEDAAESLGAGWTGGRFAGRQTGTIGRIGCFSFNGNKIMTTGGGGMIVTDDEELARRARHLTTQSRVPAVGYLHDEIGYNYRLSNVAAALGLAQLRKLDDFVAAKRRIAARYAEAFAELPVTLPPTLDETASTYWLYSILVQGADPETERDALAAHLESVGVQARPLWRPLHAQPPLKHAQLLGGSVGDDLFARGLSLPCSTGISDDELDRVITAVTDWYAGR